MSHYAQPPENTSSEAPSFVTYLKECPDLDVEWAQHLKEHGWAVVKGVVSKEKCEQFYGGMWDFMARFGTGIDRNDRATWKDENWPPALHGGLMHGYGVGHEQFVWDARSEEGIINIFAKLWNTEEILVSFDGINLTRPHLPPVAPWHHTDQSGYTVGFACSQGILNLLPNGPDDGGLLVLDKSHLKHEQFFKTHPNRLSPVDFCKIRGDDLNFYADCEEIKVCAEPGDFILFDSRTIHHSCGPKGDNVRAAMYICMAPASFATPDQIRAKKEILKNRGMTAHWPYKVTDPKPNADDRKPLHPNLPVLSERAQKLAGILPYH